MQIDEKMVRQIAKRMNCLKHLKLSYCYLDGPSVDSITELFGQQFYSFILDKTAYHPYPNMHRLIENASKLEHLSLNLRHGYSAGTLKLPTNLKSFSLHTKYKFHEESLMLLMNMARDCKNLKILHVKTQMIRPNMILAIGNIKSLVYLNLAVNSIGNKTTLKNVICHELPNLKALRIGGYCLQEMISNISRDRPDLVHLNVSTRHPYQISDSLNSLTLRSWISNVDQLPSALLFNQQNKSIQHLDIRELILPSSSKFINKLLGQFPDLKTIHCKLFYDKIAKLNLENGRKITIYFHIQDGLSVSYYKYIFPDDLPKFNTGWRPKACKGKCENLVLKKLIKEAIDGGNEPTFLDDWWIE